MAQQPLPKRQRLTALAEKYGASWNDDLKKIDPFISGLTPLKTHSSLTAEERLRVKLIEKEQRRMFRGFTTAELHAIESLAPLINSNTTLPINLAGQTIHILFDKERWDLPRLKHQIKYPLGKGRSGYWEAANPLVWETLKPCLRLASLFIQNAVVWPWWDALIFGSYETIDKNLIDPQFHSKEYSIFRNRDKGLWQRTNAAELLDATFKDAAEKLQWQLGSGHAACNTGMNSSLDSKTFNPEQQGYFSGITEPTHWSLPGDNITIWIGFEMLEPLMRTNLTSGERAVDIFRIAMTLLHELAHAVFLIEVAQDPNKPPINGEPFYEDEHHMELGHSLENALFHGLSIPFVNPTVILWSQRHLSCCGIYQQTWNTIFDCEYHDGRLPDLSPPLYDMANPYFRRDLAPIPVLFFLDICKRDYWNIHVRQYQAQATVMGPTPMCQRITIGPQNTWTKELIIKQLEAVECDNDAMVLAVSGNAPQAAQLENTRRVRALRIQEALTKQMRDRDVDERISQGMPVGTLSLPAVAPAVPPPTCPRFSEIRSYLFRHRSELALDTMVSHMPQLLVYQYIMNQGGIQLTPEEWNSFLEICEIRNELFTHMKTAMGILQRIDAGWPTDPLPLQTPPPGLRPPSRANFDLFQLIVNGYALDGEAFLDGLLDHDKEDLRALCNRTMRAVPGLVLRNEQENRVNEFGQQMFDSLLHQCYIDNVCLTYGPKGIVRWIVPPGGMVAARAAHTGGIVPPVPPRLRPRV